MEVRSTAAGVILALVAAMALGEACGSSGAGRSGTGGGSAGGAASTGGAGGTATDGSVSDGADGAGGAATSATEVCRQAITVQCARVATCEGLAMGDCTRFANPCPDYYFNADSNRTVAGIAACLGALAARTCTDLALNLFPSCFVNGKRPNGAGCAYSSQCQSGGCGTGDVCETCRPGGVPLGGACTSAACESGTFCHGGVCTAASSIIYMGAGQPCDLGATPVVGCTGDLLCLPQQTGGTAGTCSPAPGAGQPCASAGISAMICAAGTVCTAPSGGTCMVVGACGGGLPCGPSSYCQATDGGLACAPRAAVGEACGPPATVVSIPCLSPAVCLPSTGRCLVPGLGGATCDGARPCAPSLTCRGGTCQPLGSTSCPSGIDAGAD